MPCESIRVAWNNDILPSAGSIPSLQNYVSLRSSKSHRLDSLGSSFNSDSEVSMAHDSEGEFGFNAFVNQENDWMDECVAPSTQSNPAFLNGDSTMNTYEVCNDVTTTSYGPVSTSSFTQISDSSYPQNSTFITPNSYSTFENGQINTPQPPSLTPPLLNAVHGSPTRGGSLCTQNWSKPEQQIDSSQCFPENELEFSDSEEDFGNELNFTKQYCENMFQIKTPKMEELPTIKSVLCATSHCRDQRICLSHQQQQNFQPSRMHYSDSMRPRPRSGKQPILSHFLYHALENPKHYGSMIRWVSREEGIFEFQSKNKESLARAWGMVKNNRRCMTYPKMARALRKYIENGIVLKKLKNRLRYEFLQDFLRDLRNGNEPKQLSAHTIQQMYIYSRSNQGR